MTTVSLCMIVKNEEQNLPRCLDSVKDYVDEIIIVDTGSEDNTISIAKEYDANIVMHRWEGDFSAARNAGIDRASCEWILILDADEELPKETAGSIKRLASNEGVEAWSFTMESFTSLNNDSSRSKSLNIRLFKNRPEYRFEGRIHEQVKLPFSDKDKAILIRYSGLCINHYGYIREHRKKSGKSERNIEILKGQLSEKPQDSFANFNLAVSYYVTGDLKNARTHYEAAVKYVNPEMGFAPLLYRNYCICLTELGEYREALQWADYALGYYDDYADLYFVKGQIFWDLEILPEARKSFLKCADFKKVPERYSTMEGITTHMAYENLAHIFEAEKDYDKAVEYIRLALKHINTDELYMRLAVLLSKKNSNIYRIIEAIEGEFGISPETAMSILYNLGALEDCIDYAAKSQCSSKMLLIFANALIRKDLTRQALDILEGINADPADLDYMGKLLCLSCWMQQPPFDAEKHINRCIKPNTALYAAYKRINDIAAGACNAGMLSGSTGQCGGSMLDMAFSLLLLGNEDLAVRISAEADADRTLKGGYLALARLAVLKGYFETSRIYLERALKLPGDNAQIYEQLGEAYAGMGRHVRAFEYFFEAAKGEAGEKVYMLKALEQLARVYICFVKAELAKGNNPVLTEKYIGLSSFGKKLALLKEELSNGKQA